MDERKEWIGSQISWRIHVEDPTADDVVFSGEIDTAEDFGDGIIRMSGPLASGSRFVIVTDDRTFSREY